MITVLIMTRAMLDENIGQIRVIEKVYFSDTILSFVLGPQEDIHS